VVFVDYQGMVDAKQKQIADLSRNAQRSLERLRDFLPGGELILLAAGL
jgi:hypothetical protein